MHHFVRLCESDASKCSIDAERQQDADLQKRTSRMV